MPISKINQDGTVDIYNSKTGQVVSGLSPEKLGEYSPKLVAEYQQMQSPEATATRLEAEQKVAELQSPEAEEKTYTGADATRIAAAKTGIAAVERAREVLDKPGGNLKLFGATTTILPEKVGDITPFGRGLESDLFDAVDIILRQRTGAQAPETEVRRYLKQKGPRLSDTKEVKEQKLNAIRDELMTTLEVMGADKEVAGMLEDSKKKEGEAPGVDTVQVDEMGEEKNLAGLGQNAIKDVQQNIEGIMALPKVAQFLAENPSEIPNTLLEVGKGVVNEYKQLLTNPLEKAYNHPVNTVLDVIPLIPLGKAGLAKYAQIAGKSTKAIDTVGDVATASRAIGGVDDVGDVARVAEKAAVTVPETVPEVGVAEKVLSKAEGVMAKEGIKLPGRAEVASKTFSSAFIVPTKRAKSLRPRETSLKMLEYGVSGGLDDMATTASKVTGKNGVLSKVTRDAIGGLSGEVDMGGVMPSVKSALKEIIDLSPNEETRIIQNVINAETPGVAIGKMNNLDAYDLAKRLEALGHQQLSSSTYLTKNLKAEGVGKAYLNAASEIMDQLEGAAKTQDILAGLKTPETMAILEEVSPKLAQEFASAKTLSDVRSLQAPFVRLNQMIDLTNQAGQSAFQSMGRNIATRGGSAIAGGLAGSPLGPIGTLAGAAAGAVYGPPIEAMLESVRPAALTGLAKKIGKF